MILVRCTTRTLNFQPSQGKNGLFNNPSFSTTSIIRLLLFRAAIYLDADALRFTSRLDDKHIFIRNLENDNKKKHYNNQSGIINQSGVPSFETPNHNSFIWGHSSLRMHKEKYPERNHMTPHCRRIAENLSRTSVLYEGNMVARFIPRNRIFEEGTKGSSVDLARKEFLLNDYTERLSKNSKKYNNQVSSDSNLSSTPPLYDNPLVNNENSNCEGQVPWKSLPFSNRLISKKEQFDTTWKKEKTYPSLKDHELDLHDSELILTLDIDLHQLSKSETPVADNRNDKSSKMKIHMTRSPTEPISNTLKRLQISTAKRIRHFESKLSGGKVPRAKKETKSSARDSSSKSNDQGGDNGNNIKIILGGLCLDTSLFDSIGDLLREACQRQLANITQNGASFSGGLSIWIPDQGVYLSVVSLPPTILEVYTFESFQQNVFTGVPLFVECDLLYASHFEAVWYTAPGSINIGDENTISSVPETAIAVAVDSTSYVPTNEDLGKIIFVKLTPRREGHNGEGCEEIKYFKNCVEPHPTLHIVHNLREDWTKPRDDSDSVLRVMTYNILGDFYASREFESRGQFQYCELIHLKKTRRMPLIVSEILAYHPDIICLQEVDTSIYDDLLRPALASKGYLGFHSEKISEQKEGCAIFWSNKVFELENSACAQTIPIRDLFYASSNDGWDGMQSIVVLFNEHDELSKITQEKIGQIMQTVTLKLRKSAHEYPSHLLVANTHLFYHPLASHIRALQTFAVCRRIDESRKAAYQPPLPFILCGDLNSTPRSGAFKLLVQRHLPSSHSKTWCHLNSYTWDVLESDAFRWNEEEKRLEYVFDPKIDPSETGIRRLFPPDLSLPDSFPKLIQGCHPIPEFTNFVRGFVETLDYILASTPDTYSAYGFEQSASAPMPPKKDIDPYVGMPNEVMPSDHVSVVCDLKWKLHH